MMDAGRAAVVSAPPARARQHLDRSPWYRQFWPWFLIALPALSVILSFATLFLATRNADAVIPHEGDSTSYAAPHEPVRIDVPSGPDSAHGAAKTRKHR